ncbi:MAG: RNA polymerase factor sigma-54 [Bacteroidetes bacterium]|nr:RNA polymerase factor sigma-54 [Bacteroidota bacterium]
MLKQGLHQKQQQKLSPQQIQFIQLLQLNTTELEKRVDEELAENPALENDKDEDHNGENEETFDNDLTNEADDSPDDDEKSEEEFEEKVKEEEEVYDQDLFDESLNDYLAPEGEDDYSYSIASDPNQENKEIPFAEVNNLYDQLYEQLSAHQLLDDRQKILGNHLIGMIEEDGYLRRPLKNIAYDLAFLNQMQCSEEELEYVLKIIQTFDPAGIGCRSLNECLLLQLNRRDATDPRVVLAKKIVKDHLDDLARKHYEKIYKALRIERDELKEAVDVITHLDPKPGESQINTKTQYITPDFIVTNVDGEMLVTLNSRNVPELRVSKNYQDALKSYQENTKDKNLKKQAIFIKQKLDGAKWFVEAVRQRQNTLLQTMKNIVEYQRNFFEEGDIEQLEPMILKDIADRIQMDISTVSRVANSKYVQTDFGIYSLKEFFSEGIQTDSGEEVSNKEVKKILRDLINGESKNRPLTDERLTELLNEKGYNIARRTVAKYREQMDIQVARLRKEL